MTTTDRLITKELEETEILLKPQPERYAVYPIQYPHIWKFYKKSLASFWNVEEVDMSQDVIDWETKLNDDERHFIKMTLAYFASADVIVNVNLAERFIREIQIHEARNVLVFQMAMEDIHSEMYSLLIDVLIRDSAEKLRLFKAIETVPAVKRKAEWAQKWIKSESASFAQRVIGMACVEGIMFSGSFCALYWLKKRSLMPGTTFSNEVISRDEGLHTDFGCLLYSMLEHKLPESVVHEIVNEAVEIEDFYITESLPVGLIGMNAELMSQYIRFVADRLLVALGYNKLYNEPLPFDWMNSISLQTKTNFFEKRVAEYQKAGVMAAQSGEDVHAFSIDEDF